MKMELMTKLESFEYREGDQSDEASNSSGQYGVWSE